MFKLKAFRASCEADSNSFIKGDPSSCPTYSPPTALKERLSATRASQSLILDNNNNNNMEFPQMQRKHSIDSSRLLYMPMSLESLTSAVQTNNAIHTMGFKCVLGEDVSFIRILPHKLRFFQLIQEINKIYGDQSFKVKYVDQEGDSVWIKDGSSLSYAYNDWRDRSKKTPMTWKFHIKQSK